VHEPSHEIAAVLETEVFVLLQQRLQRRVQREQRLGVPLADGRGGRRRPRRVAPGVGVPPSGAPRGRGRGPPVALPSVSGGAWAERQPSLDAFALTPASLAAYGVGAGLPRGARVVVGAGRGRGGCTTARRSGAPTTGDGAGVAAGGRGGGAATSPCTPSRSGGGAGPARRGGGGGGGGGGARRSSTAAVAADAGRGWDVREAPSTDRVRHGSGGASSGAVQAPSPCARRIPTGGVRGGSPAPAWGGGGAAPGCPVSGGSGGRLRPSGSGVGLAPSRSGGALARSGGGGGLARSGSDRARPAMADSAEGAASGGSGGCLSPSVLDGLSPCYHGAGVGVASAADAHTRPSAGARTPPSRLAPPRPTPALFLD